MHQLLPQFRRRKLRRRGGLTFRRSEQELEQVFITQVSVVASRSLALAIARTPETCRPPILLQTLRSGPARLSAYNDLSGVLGANALSARWPCPVDHASQEKASDCASVLNAMRCGKRCTSCGQPT